MKVKWIYILLCFVFCCCGGGIAYVLHALPSVILGLFLLFFFHFAQIAGVDFGSGKANTNIKTILFISFFINAGIGLILIFTNAAIPMVLLAQGAYSSVVIIAELVVFNKLKSV